MVLFRNDGRDLLLILWFDRPLVRNTLIHSVAVNISPDAPVPVTSTSAFGSGIQPPQADAISEVLVQDPLNADLQWSEGSYRGFFTLELTPQTANATYYAMRNVSAYRFY